MVWKPVQFSGNNIFMDRRASWVSLSKRGSKCCSKWKETCYTEAIKAELHEPQQARKKVTKFGGSIFQILILRWSWKIVDLVMQLATFLLAAVVLYFIIGSVTNNDFGLPPSKVCETQIDYRKIIVFSANSSIEFNNNLTLTTSLQISAADPSQGAEHQNLLSSFPLSPWKDGLPYFYIHL